MVAKVLTAVPVMVWHNNVVLLKPIALKFPIFVGGVIEFAGNEPSNRQRVVIVSMSEYFNQLKFTHDHGLACWVKCHKLLGFKQIKMMLQKISVV